MNRLGRLRPANKDRLMLLQKAKSESAFLKLGLYGESGAGKTYTASSIAIGLCDFIKSKKPVAFLDTETGSDYVRHRFDEAGLELLVAKTRAFKDLLSIVDEAEKECSVLIIDSVTHPWDELVSAYMKANNRSRLTLKDWQPLKATWREFTDKYLNSHLHIIMCGRSADKWAEVEDEDGAMELRKTGTKMKTEKDLGYEPSLLVEMEAVQLSSKVGGAYIRRAYVKKDRFGLLDGKVFDNPDFQTFLPHVQLLNLGGEHRAIDTTRTSEDMLKQDFTGERKAFRRDVVLEKIENEIKLLYPGQSEKDRTAKIKILVDTFGTNSWTEIQGDRVKFPMDLLEGGLAKIEETRAVAEGRKVSEPVSVKPEPPADNGNGKSKAKGAHA